MSESILRQMAIEQRKRLVAGVMNAAEGSPWWSRLRPEEQRAYRQMVLDKIGVYHDFMLDMIKVSDDTQIVSEDTMRLLERVHISLRNIEKQTRRPQVNSGPR
jgi:hypothetical protein